MVYEKKELQMQLLSTKYDSNIVLSCVKHPAYPYTVFLYNVKNVVITAYKITIRIFDTNFRF